MSLKPGILRKGEGIDDVHWNILGQVYTPKSITEDCFSWHALLPAESFVPPHIHPTQDEFILVQEGELELKLDGVWSTAKAGDLVRMACERHLMDLETGADRGLYFDCDAASRIIRWAGMLQHTTGPMGGQPLKLEPWQEFRHGSVFGWKHRETGLRRFRSTYHQVGKKNGKTTDTGVPMHEGATRFYQEKGAL